MVFGRVGGVGDQLAVSGDSLPMLVAGKGKGSLNLKLESFEAVAGHPCGVFSVSGTYSRKKFPDFEGNLTDEDVTIQSGKIWLSLIHPIVLKEERNSRLSKTPRCLRGALLPLALLAPCCR